MQSGLLHRSHYTPFLLRNPPCPSTSNSTPSPRFPFLSSRISALHATYPRGAPDSAGKRDGHRRLKARKRSRRWWSDDGVSETEELAPGFWEDFLDNMWFYKVLESYGWLSPIIIISWLAASGPKAFLMSFSIPLGLSFLTYAFKKLSQWIQRRFRRTYFKPTRATDMENVTMEEEEEEIQWKSKQRTPDRSDSVESDMENGSITSNGAPSFGGWEDLIDERELRRRRARRSRRETERTSVPLEERMRELKMRVEGERDLPLPLKFLVAIFPFLSFWTDLL